MPELILPYRREGIPQSTGWWCGPASARIVLSARGIHVPEAELAAEIGTHTGGTDHIGWIVDRSFRHRIPDAGYTGVPMPNDPPSSAQRDAFWTHLTRSVRAGHGLVMNWVAPPSNYPRGIKGSQSPSYGPGTVYHYVTAMGFDDSHPGGAVWVVDPGFRPFEFWCARAQVEELLPPKAYAWASAAAAVGPTPPPPTPAADPLAVLIAAMAPTTVSQQRFSELLPGAVHALERCDCRTVNRIAMFCSQIGHESGGLRYAEEIADGSAYEGRQDLGNVNPGDGKRFKGRSFIQVTGRHNYGVLSAWAHANGYVPTPTYFVDNPAELASARFVWLGVIWYWTVARPQINSMSDNRDLEGVTRAINGGLNGLADRRERWNRCLAMGDSLLDLTGPTLEEGFLMALTEDEQREILAVCRILATDRHMSISPFRHLDEQGNKAAAVTTPVRTNFIDGNVHVIMTMMLASLGDHEHLNLLREVASAANDPGKYPDRQAHARLAAEVLAWAEESGRPELAPPPPPSWLCVRNNSNVCAFGGGDTCSVSASGRCISAELAELEGV